MRKSPADRVSTLVLALMLTIGGGACGDGNGDGDSGDLQAFCDQAAALDRLNRPPTDEELDRLVEVAPDEIEDEAVILVEAAREFREGNENAADSPEIQQAGNRLDEFVENSCRGA